MGMATVSVVVAAVSARGWTLRKRQVLSTAQAAIAAGAFFGLALSANAAPQDNAIADLRSFVQTMPATPEQDASIAALGDFLRTRPAPQAPMVKVAEADNLFDQLQEWSKPQDGSSAKAQVPIRRKAVKVVDATTVGDKTCLGCHSAVADKFGHTLMGRLQKQGKLTCETCHGPGSEHARLGGGRGVGGIISFRPDDENFDVNAGNQICLGCHLKGERVYWPGSTHQVRGVACSNCHTIMQPVSRKNQLKTAFQPDTCFQCHQEIRAKITRSSHMPVREGKIVCSDCHNPHGSATEKLLRTATINETCYKCHAEKRGPFLFEHAPVRENCLNCHDPHGSVNEYMLKIARPRLCTECHGFGHGTTSGPMAVQTISRQCQNCHTEVHGTNSPSGPLLHR
jgi:DmsE family decaheme c-type cytochrome